MPVMNSLFISKYVVVGKIVDKGTLFLSNLQIYLSIFEC